MPNMLQSALERLGVTGVAPDTIVGRMIDFDPENAFKSTTGLHAYEYTTVDSPHERKEICEHLSQAVSCYPSSFIVEMIRKIYVVRDLRLNDVAYGGTCCHRPRGVILSTIGAHGEMSRYWLDQAFHHELAHLVVQSRWMIFPHLKWKRTNPPGFRYSHKNGFEALKAGLTDSKDPHLHTQGFVSAYGASSYEEDIVSYAEKMFSWRDHGFWRAVELNWRMKQKVEIMREFYRSAHPKVRFPDE